MNCKDFYSHIQLLFTELYNIYNICYVYKAVEQEWDSRIYSGNIPEDYPLRMILLDSLNYRVFLGLNKIFSTQKDEFSLIKATNQAEQLFPSNDALKTIIKEIRSKHDSSEMVKTTKHYRDTFFAHLDKKSINLYTRIDASATMAYITEKEIKEWIGLVAKFIEAAFGSMPVITIDIPTKESIVKAFFED